MLQINDVRFCFEGKYYCHVFSVGESHPQFDEVSKIAKKLDGKFDTFKPIYMKEINGKKFVSIQLRGITKYMVLNEDQKGNTYDLKIEAFEKTGGNGKLYCNLYCSGIVLNTKKDRESKADIGKPLEF